MYHISLHWCTYLGVLCILILNWYKIEWALRDSNHFPHWFIYGHWSLFNIILSHPNYNTCLIVRTVSGSLSPHTYVYVYVRERDRESFSWSHKIQLWIYVAVTFLLNYVYLYGYYKNQMMRLWRHQKKINYNNILLVTWIKKELVQLAKNIEKPWKR